MPEGHTLHRLAGELTGTFAGETVAASSPQGRFTAGAARIDGLVLVSAEAHGKHLLLDFGEPDATLHLHLGLYGGLSLSPGTGRPVVGAVRLRLEGSSHAADLRGPAICTLLGPDEVETLLARLGPDPLRSDAEPEAAWCRINASGTPIAALLMNQKIIAGVGNIYRAELLFRHGIDPLLPGRELQRATWQEMWTDLTHLMSAGMRSGRIDTVRPQHEPEAMGRPSRKDDHGGEVYVYRRTHQACLVCGTEVRSNILAGRNLFWCPGCQHRG